MGRTTHKVVSHWAKVVMISAFAVSASIAQKKPFDASQVVSPELLNGPSSATHDQLKRVKLDQKEFASVAAMADIDTGQIRQMNGNIELPQTGTEQARVEAFIRKNAELLGATVEGGDLKLIREVKSPTGDHYYYQQLYKGFPVWGGRVSVHNVLGSKAAQVVNDLRKLSSPSEMSLDYNPGFSESNRAKAIEVAEQVVKFKTLSSQQPIAEQGFLEVHGTPVAVWRVRYTTSEPGATWEVMVDSLDLKSLSVRNIAVYRQNPTASVFHADPVGVTGNQNLVPPATHNDASFPIIQSARLAVALSELGGRSQLDGTFASTRLTTAFPRATSPTFDFTFDWDDPHFRETMAYYWVTECAHYLARLGYGNILTSPIEINVDGTPDDNSFYQNGSLVFGSGGVPDAEDAEVIWHELGHAIQDAQVPGLLNDGGQEVRAMSEGFGDYWAASYFAGQGPNAAAWDIFFDKWDGITAHPAVGSDPPFLRRLDSVKKYPINLVGEVHEDGEIWSACLWKLRGILGKDLTAKILLEANFKLTPTSSFADGANAILAANLQINSEKNNADIRRVFEDRGILKPAVAKSPRPNPKK